MARRVWIIPKGEKITQAVIDAAKANNCTEINQGISRSIADKGAFEEMLPMSYEEPDSPPSPKPRDLAAEIDLLKEAAEIDSLKESMEKLELRVTELETKQTTL